METVLHKGRAWRETGTELYVRKDGSETVLRVWQSKCVVCGAPITCRTPMDHTSSRAFGLCHCEKHKQ